MIEQDTIQEERLAAALVLGEQERLGRQLHDTLGPQITAISMWATSWLERLQNKNADELHLRPRTVETYRKRIKAKLGLKASAERSRRAVQWVLQNE